MKIATFNINSRNARLDIFLPWLRQSSADIVLLQEIKTQVDSFPFFEINAAGYNVEVLGQKAYNGVAVLSKEKINVRTKVLPDFLYDEARYLEVETNGMIVSSVYMPNGNPLGSEKYKKKLKFMDCFYEHARQLKMQSDKIIFGGDFNVVLTNFDVYNPSVYKNDAIFQDEVKRKLKALEYLGYFDAYRTLYQNETGYTYWDYGSSAFVNDFGLRLDYILCSALMLEKLVGCTVDKNLRKAQKPSDHTPVIAEFEV